MQKNSQLISRLATPKEVVVGPPAVFLASQAYAMEMRRGIDADVSAGTKPSSDRSASAGLEATGPSQTPAERDQAMVEHLAMVRFIARRIHERIPQHVEMEDLVSAGVLGLMDAFQKFDPAKKVQFRSYAQFRVRGAILDSLRLLDWSPRELRRKGRAVEEAIRILTQRLRRSPSEAEIAQELEVDLAEYQQLLGDLRGLDIGTLHIEHAEDSDEEELAYLPANPQDDPLSRCLRAETQQKLANAIEALPERERMVVTLYYHEEMTMREIGLALGVVESRVSQIHSSAVLRLRAAIHNLPDRKRGACAPRINRNPPSLQSLPSPRFL